MLTVCAWCERDGEPETIRLVQSAVLGEQISHGICEEHAKAMLEELRAAA